MNFFQPKVSQQRVIREMDADELKARYEQLRTSPDFTRHGRENRKALMELIEQNYEQQTGKKLQ